MIHKVTCSASGKKFYPSRISNRLEKDFCNIDFHESGDKKKIVLSNNHSVDGVESKLQLSNGRIEYTLEESYDYGYVSFWHPRKFAINEVRANYENELVEKLLSYREMFIESGANEFIWFYEVFYKRDQCNFELLNAQLVKMLATSFDISFPISAYRLEEDQYHDWAGEIKREWGLN
ncbi:MAG: hypothetical protein AAGC85_09075 [Bacteroidota bacterium]